MAPTLNIALVVLKIEAFIYIGFYGLICCLIMILTAMLVYFSIICNRRMIRNHHRTVRIQKAIKEIAQFKISARHFRTIKPTDMLGLQDEQVYCCICTEKIESEDDLVELPCNENHEFHVKCIKEWFEICQICPCCKTCIRERISGLSFSSSSSNINNM